MSKEFSTWHKVQVYFNTINHIFNGGVAVFLTLYLIRKPKVPFAWHVWLTTIGYQLFMAEAIMAFYSPNSWSSVNTYRAKRHFHWILQLIASAFVIAGNVVIIYIYTLPHFKSIHAITGKIYNSKA